MIFTKKNIIFVALICVVLLGDYQPGRALPLLEEGSDVVRITILDAHNSAVAGEKADTLSVPLSHIPDRSDNRSRCPGGRVLRYRSARHMRDRRALERAA